MRGTVPPGLTERSPTALSWSMHSRASGMSRRVPRRSPRESRTEGIATSRCHGLNLPSGGRVNEARIQQLLDRLDRRWPDGGPAASSDIIRSAQPHLDELEEADRALARATQNLKQADSREIILSRDVAGFLDHRDELAQRVMETAHQAFRQKSASREAELRRLARAQRRELRAFDERLAVQQGELAAARREARLKRIRLGPLRRRVSNLEETIGRLFPLATPAEDDNDPAASEDWGDAHRAESGDGHQAAHGVGDKNVVPPEDRKRTRSAQVRRRTHAAGLRKTEGRRLRRIRWRRPRRRQRVRITRMPRR